MARGASATITVIGDLLEDVVVWPTGHVRRGTDNSATITRSRGGSAANVAAAVVAAGGSARFIGRIGDDDLGLQLSGRLRDCGVDVRVQHVGRTGSVVVLVDTDGERTMFPDRAAAAELTMVDPAWLAGTAVLHLPAYALSTSARPVTVAAAEVRRLGGRITVDLAAASLITAVGADTLRVMITDLQPAVVFANADEAEAIGASSGDGEAPWPIVVIKRGPDPAVVVRADGTVVEVPAEPVRGVVDTTGAGDGFAGAFLAAWVAGGSVEAACGAGHRGAAAVLTTPGAGR